MIKTECPYYQYAVVNEDGDDFYDLCYGEEKGEYCCDEENKNCLYRQLQQLKAENEKLSTQNYYLDKANLGLAEENENYLQCLDEIEKIANTLECDCAIRDILQLIKETKESEE